MYYNVRLSGEKRLLVRGIRSFNKSRARDVGILLYSDVFPDSNPVAIYVFWGREVWILGWITALEVSWEGSLPVHSTVSTRLTLFNQFYLTHK